MPQGKPSGRLRPLDLRRDFEELGRLIEIAFAEDLQRTGVPLREELNIGRRLLPWIGLLGRLSSSVRELMSGYVWEDQGKIVGLVMLQPEGLGSERRKWVINTVATHPDYRGRGIARRLMSSALEHIRKRGGELAALTVRTDNSPAIHLYESLGFTRYDGITQLRLDGTPDVELKPVEGYRLRPMGLGEWRRHYELAKEAIPPEVQEFNPISEREYRLTPWMRVLIPFFSVLQRTDYRRWAAEAEGRRLVGVLTLRAVRYPSRHQIRLLIHPEHEDAAEALLTQALSVLKDYQGCGVLAGVRSSRAELLGLFERYGFSEVDSSYRMALKLR